jgi:hypothetical protein
VGNFSVEMRKEKGIDVQRLRIQRGVERKKRWGQARRGRSDDRFVNY